MKHYDKTWLIWRISNWFFHHHLKPLASLSRFIVRVVLSADIPPQLEIGKGTKFPHMALGSLFHPAAKIGTNCVLLHGITVGGKSGHDKLPVIGNNVWIGAHSIILGNIKIGDNSVIGVGSVVVKDVPENAIVAGNPAKILKYKECVSGGKTL